MALVAFTRRIYFPAIEGVHSYFHLRQEYFPMTGARFAACHVFPSVEISTFTILSPASKARPSISHFLFKAMAVFGSGETKMERMSSLLVGSVSFASESGFSFPFLTFLGT